MNFWRASILPLVLAAAAFLGLCTPNASAGHEGRAFERVEAPCSTWFGWYSASDEVPVAQTEYHAEGEEDDCFSGTRKRSRKCWRPEQTLAIALVRVNSPAEALRPCCPGLEQRTPAPAVSDILFIAGGYVRLFQKG